MKFRRTRESSDPTTNGVYEYDWDLKNGNGAMVMPGVYLYLIRADGLHDSNKAVVIRWLTAVIAKASAAYQKNLSVPIPFQPLDQISSPIRIGSQ